jgi:hypothetical protein
MGNANKTTDRAFRISATALSRFFRDGRYSAGSNRKVRSLRSSS